MSLLDTIVSNHGNGSGRIVSVNNDLGSINWVNGLSDPGEMVGCGRYQQLRRLANEGDEAYQSRLIALLPTIPAEDRRKIEDAMKAAALRRASLSVNGRGEVQLAVAGKAAWHVLGTVFDGPVNSEQMNVGAHLNYNVSKRPLQYVDATGTVREATGTFGLVRDDTHEFLNSVGSKYQVVQNVQGSEFLDGVLGEFGARYEAAGALHNGRSVFYLVHLPRQSFVVNGGDEQHAYALFVNHHGEGAASCFATSERVVCANTLRLAIKGNRGKGITIRHTGSIKGKIEDAQVALGLTVKSFDTYKEQAETLYAKPLEVKHYVNDVLDAVLEITAANALKGADALAAVLNVTEANRELARKSIAAKIERRGEILEDILERYESDRCGIGSIRGTAWAAFNAVTEHADHNNLGRQARDTATRESRRFENTLTGDADTLKQTALEFALKA